MCSSLNSCTSSTAIVLLHWEFLCCMTCSGINWPPLPLLLHLPTAPKLLTCFGTVTSKPSRSRVPRTACAIFCFPSQSECYRWCQKETPSLSYVTLPNHWFHLRGVLVICSVLIWPSISLQELRRAPRGRRSSTLQLEVSSAGSSRAGHTWHRSRLLAKPALAQQSHVSFPPPSTQLWKLLLPFVRLPPSHQDCSQYCKLCS